MKKNLKKIKIESFGFTLIELLIAVAVIGLVIAAAIPAINTFNQNQLIANAQKDVQSLLRQAQSKALAAEVDRRFCDVEKTSLKGWYVGFDDSASSYKIFGKCISDQSHTTIAQFNQSTVYLPSNHVFTNMPGGSSAFYVMFQPASAEVWFYNQTTSDNGPLNCPAAVPPDSSQCYSPSRLSLASLTIKNTITGQTKIIEVYANGQIKGL